MKSPFKFLDAYTIEDRDVFFGRQREVEELYNMAFQSSLILVYGLSGTGKTSLIQCGLAARFDKADWNPFFIRRGDNINDSLHKRLDQALPADAKAGEKTSEKVSYLFRYFLRPVYLVFDQFEELFILGDKAEQEAFGRSIQEIIQQELPCKIVLVMREEFIAQLYSLERYLPMLYDHRLRVEPMNFSKIQDVLLGSFRKFNIQLSDPKGDTALIYKNVSAGKFGVQLPYLQVYLDLLYREDFARTYPDREEVSDALPPITFTTEEIKSFGRIEGVLGRFLRERTEVIEKQLAQAFPELPKDTIHHALDAFVTAEGTKRPVPFEQGEEFLSVDIHAPEYLRQLSPPVLTACLTALEENRILRRRNDAFELAHDSLAELVEEQRTEEQRQLKEATLLVRNNYQEYRETGEHLTQKELDSIEDLLEEMPLSVAERRFVTASQRAITLRKQRRNTAIITASFAVLLTLTLWAFRNENKAQQSEERARANLELASDYFFEVMPTFDVESEQNSPDREARYTEEERVEQLRALNTLIGKYESYQDSLELPLPYVVADGYRKRALLWAEADSIDLALRDLDNLIGLAESDNDSTRYNGWKNSFLIRFRKDSLVAIESGQLTITVQGEEGIRVSDGDDEVLFRSFRSGVDYVGNETINRRWDSISDYLTEVQVNSSSRRLLTAALPPGANFDRINSGNNAFLSFGILQWNLGARGNEGELPALLKKIKTFHPDEFERYFGRHNLDVHESTNNLYGFLVINGEVVNTTARKELFQTPEWGFRFWLAGLDPKIQAVQVEHALSRLQRFYTRSKVYDYPVNQVVTSEYGAALLLDNHVQLPAQVTKALEAAMDSTGLSNPVEWGTEKERRLLDAYIQARARKVGGFGPMPDAMRRAEAIKLYVERGMISDERGSFKSSNQ